MYLCSRTISILEENEAKKQAEVTLQRDFEERLALLTASYVEQLDEDHLFQQMFSSDKGMYAVYSVIEHRALSKQIKLSYMDVQLA